LALLSFSLPAAAQVKGGEFRLFVDTDLFTYERTTIEKPGSRDIESSIEFGPGGAALNGSGHESSTGAGLPGYVGLGFGYAFHRRFVPSFHFSAARRQSIHEVEVNNVGQPSVEERSVLTFMLRPELEVLLNPEDRAVAAALIGFDVRRSRIAGSGADTYERELTALGPVAGVVGHFFLVKKASLDVGVVAVIDFVKARGSGPDLDAVNYSNVVITLMMGMSIWP
jgi:hypothetical protein